ncbi:hypothetical protein ACSBR2_019654 [Camellia fascicularis]
MIIWIMICSFCFVLSIWTYVFYALHAYVIFCFVSSSKYSTLYFMFYINLCFLVTKMAKGEKQWIKPGFLARSKLTEYEKERNKTIKKNNKKINALQEMCIAASLMDSTQPNRVNENGKNIRVEVDYDDYIPLDHRDDTDDSFKSVDDEVLYV